MRLVALLLAFAAGAACAQDYEREKRWADQVVPDIIVGDAVRIRLPAGREFLGIHAAAPGAKASVLLVHGIGVHPDHGVIGILRAALADAGYTTLSIQMPVQASDAGAEAYHPALFPEAVQRIAAGAKWLQDKGAKRIVLLSHSLGSWMSSTYIEGNPAPAFAAWVNMGMSRGVEGMARAKIPVLDVYGEQDLSQVLKAAPDRLAAIRATAGSGQVRIAGADHHYLGREKALEAAIRGFIEKLK